MRFSVDAPVLLSVSATFMHHITYPVTSSHLSHSHGADDFMTSKNKKEISPYDFEGKKKEISPQHLIYHLHIFSHYGDNTWALWYLK